MWTKFNFYLLCNFCGFIVGNNLFIVKYLHTYTQSNSIVYNVTVDK